MATELTDRVTDEEVSEGLKQRSIEPPRPKDIDAPDSGWHRKSRCFQHRQVLLEPFVLLFSVRPVVDLPVAIGADRTDPSGVVRSAVGQPPGVVGLQVGGPVFPAEGGRRPA